MAFTGEQAERFVEERVRAVLPEGARCYANVRIVAKVAPHKPAHDGEADLVIVHPEHGLLVIETKAGTPRREADDTWFLGGRKLDRSPFRQAEAAKHDLVAEIADVLALTNRRDLRAGHAVAFPEADVASLPPGHVLLGPDAPRDIVLDAEAFEDEPHTRRALERAWAWWTGDRSKGFGLSRTQLEAVDEYLSPAYELPRLIKRDVDDGRDRLRQASRAQRIVLNQHRNTHRLEVVGPAGSGKSLVAVEKARRLARDGYRTLFVCFNSPLAAEVLREIDDVGEPPDRRPMVVTFHRLCELFGAKAGMLAPKPAGELPPEWFDTVLPKALDRAIDALPGERFHAVVVDEGQDFELDWLLSLQLLLRDSTEDVLWVFHDPGQALFRDDRVAELALGEPLELFEDYRSPAPVAALAARFYHGPSEPYAVTESGREPVIVTAEPGRATTEAVRKQLHELIEVQGIRPWNIVVLSGHSATKSDAWRQRTFGNVELWNGAIDDEGRTLGLPADQLPQEPADAGIVRFETIRRFKGLERPVVILCELPEEARRLDALLYVGLTRATAHLVVIAPASLAARLGQSAAAPMDPR